MPAASTETRTIGEIVAADFRTATVFEKHGIDFCCGGQVALAEVCRARALDPDAISAELAAVTQEPVVRSQDYAVWSLTFLADYIVNTHHGYLREIDPQLVAYTRKIAAVHGAHHPELLQIAALFERIAADLVGHLRDEEEVFFPALKRAEAAKTADQPVAAHDRELIRASLLTLQREHEEIGAAVHALRRLSRDYAIPADVCNTVVVTYRKLREFEEDLHKHVHLENNLLFFKAAQL